VSNQVGRFIIPDVSPGTCDIVFAKPGFSTHKFNRQDVKVTEILTIDATLEIGQVTSVVEVSSTPGAELQMVNASVGTVRYDRQRTVPDPLPIFATTFPVRRFTSRRSGRKAKSPEQCSTRTPSSWMAATIPTTWTAA